MKISNVILIAVTGSLLVVLVICNFLLRKEFDKLDKSDTYWTYGKILEQPFRHLIVTGGNLSTIAFQPASKPSVRVLRMWRGYKADSVHAVVKGDTLYLKFPLAVDDPFEKRYMGWNTLVRLFSPELISINGRNTNVKLEKLRQKNLKIHISGKSSVEVETEIHHLDTIDVTQSDSSRVKFEISPELKGSPLPSITEISSEKVGIGGVIVLNDASRVTGVEGNYPSSWETISIKNLKATITGVSILDVGHAQTGKLDLDIADSSALIISGQSLRLSRDR